MTKYFPEIAKRISHDMEILRRRSPNLFHDMSAMPDTTTSASVLGTKTREFIALSLGVAAGCDNSIAAHAEALVRLGASRDEFEEALGVAIHMGGAQSVAHALDAISAYEQYQDLANTPAPED